MVWIPDFLMKTYKQKSRNHVHTAQKEARNSTFKIQVSTARATKTVFDTKLKNYITNQEHEEKTKSECNFDEFVCASNCLFRFNFKQNCHELQSPAHSTSSYA
ncbi:uncharacterized protein PHALS_14856 [Plasmopara halstedii]|uniref:Uncharacterized protein n=1 Tax=Plasmopara halstedii TaxID=4781 RepID=A0A0P1AWY5_PLAHL|nr:uncharacterized protein PHALS_14856 [Plasmopara halstedii]CEG46009.1 hypothetical protein PHALS_14856 [Plasmopara halstedii]|eukprot:XP_024582378.1 hypothetical protein PHALS_14856 [Plasmopara halstedii]